MSAKFRSEEQCVPLLYLIDPCERIIIFLTPPVIADLIPERSAAQESIYADHTVKMSVVLSGLLNTHFDIGKRAQKSSDRREILFIDVLSAKECSVDIWGNFLFHFIDISLHIIAESFKKFEQPIFTNRSPVSMIAKFQQPDFRQ